MRKISAYLKGTGREMIIGDYTVRELEDGDFAIEHENGEVMYVTEDDLEEKISEIYRESF